MILRGYIHYATVPLDKRRPVVILSPDRRNALASDVVVVPCSTQRRYGPWHVPLRSGEGGLFVPSVVRCEAITTLPKRLIDPKPLGGPLGGSRLREIEAHLMSALGIDLPE